MFLVLIFFLATILADTYLLNIKELFCPETASSILNYVKLKLFPQIRNLLKKFVFTDESKKLCL